MRIVSSLPFFLNIVLLDHVFFRAVTFYSYFSESWQQWCIFLVVSYALLWYQWMKPARMSPLKCLAIRTAIFRATIAFQGEFGNFRLLFHQTSVLFACLFVWCVAVLYLFIFHSYPGQFIQVNLNKIIT